MADNTTLNPGASGDTLRDVDKSGIKTPVVILDIGGTGTEALFDGTVKATVDDASQSYTDGQNKALSMTSDGRLRVVTANEAYNLAGWGEPEKFSNQHAIKTFSAW